VCGPGHLELVRGLGAGKVIDYLDSVGKSSFSQCKRLLKPRGIYLSSELGPWAQNPIRGLIAPLQGGKKVMFPIPKHDQPMIRHLSAAQVAAKVSA